MGVTAMKSSGHSTAYPQSLLCPARGPHLEHLLKHLVEAHMRKVYCAVGQVQPSGSAGDAGVQQGGGRARLWHVHPVPAAGQGQDLSQLMRSSS